jgi:hypothetical protein
MTLRLKLILESSQVLKSVFLALAILLVQQVSARDSTGVQWTFASDVSPWLMEGYSLKVGALIQDKYELSAELFSINIPDFTIDLNSKNQGLGWSEKVDFGAALYFDRRLTSRRSSFYFGGAVVYLKHTASLSDLRYEYSQMEYMMRLSYQWFPFAKNGFYVQPYVALAGRHHISGNNGTYELTPFLIIPSVYLSWRI